MSSQVSPMNLTSATDVTQAQLDSFNIEQDRDNNRKNLDDIGGPEGLLKLLNVNPKTGLSADQVNLYREKYGENRFPESPMDSYLDLLIAALSDFTLIILIAAATVSTAIGIYEDIKHHKNGSYIEGVAIYIAVILVSNIAAGNDYSKQLQFKALEATSQADERATVVRDGQRIQLNPVEICVGDILVLQAGDQVPADCIIVTENIVLSNESSLTGEPDDLKKSKEKDCFLLSACLLTEGEEVLAIAIGIGVNSQWGKIKANLVTEAVNTPLQDKLEDMTQMVGYIGCVSAAATFLVAIIYALVDLDEAEIRDDIVGAFIIAVTIIVVAIPEGLPLAVTIALAYSTKKMYTDMCFIRVLAACETMGNATNICSDKTGTLTQNEMTVVEGWFADRSIDQDEFTDVDRVPPNVKAILAEQISINRTAYLLYVDANGKEFPSPKIIGNKTEGALIKMIRTWGFDYEKVMEEKFDPHNDRIFSFNSAKKRSTAIIHRKDGSVILHCKGASEWILKDCTHFLDNTGQKQTMTEDKRSSLLNVTISNMAKNALRTLCLSHREFKSASDLPQNWKEEPPDHEGLILDCIVGIIDPLRDDVKEAVATAQTAGVTVRMVTGDNIETAKAIARKCGILTSDGMAIEGPTFRNTSPRDVDNMLPKLQVMARSSPEDKYLMVTRLNGYAIPATQEEWEKKHAKRIAANEVTWDKDKDLLMPGYLEEWEATRPLGGEVVGVTGDGTNDAPALKAADVGLAMGITGTKVAQGAADIVILDDRFSSIIKAIKWGRAVYDSVRKFIQFQLTVNLVALMIVFIGTCAQRPPPLSAVQLLWVNLVMDTMGALALATELPTPELLLRKPYKRTASLISWPMWRNIWMQALFQMVLLLVLLFEGSKLFNVSEEGPTFTAQGTDYPCQHYDVGGKDGADSKRWTVNGKQGNKDSTDDDYAYSCSTYKEICNSEDRTSRNYRGDIGYPTAKNKGNKFYEQSCFNRDWEVKNPISGATEQIRFSDFENFQPECLDAKDYCLEEDFTKSTIIFNAFIFAQLFNEYNARVLGDKLNCFEGIETNPIFIGVTIFSVLCQIMLVEVGGRWVSTTALSWDQWLITIALGAISIPVGLLMRFIPIEENPETFFDSTMTVQPVVEAQKMELPTVDKEI